jgi:glycerol-3-phosphate dehydrogenase
LEDWWVRRSLRAWFDPEPLATLAPAADEMAGLLGWSDDEKQRQVEACVAIHKHNLAFQGKTA